MRQKVVLASSNAGKIREIRALLRDREIDIVAQSELAIPDRVETGLTFIENAIIKARHATRHSGLPAIADDSGLEVDALGGAPGVLSSRYAGAGATDEANVDKLLVALDALPDEQRGARFYCAIVYLRHEKDPRPLIGEGLWEGRILRERRGTGGFGYDPVFWVAEKGCASAELAAEEKNSLSHRYKALSALIRRL